MEVVLECCRKADANGDGSISKAELASVIQESMPEYTKDQAAELLQQVDGDEDGKVSYEEFLAWIVGEDWPDDECFALSVQLHTRADTNFSGFVSVDEMMETRRLIFEHLGLDDEGADCERQRLEEQDARIAGIDVLWLAEWAKCFKPVCELAGTEEFKEAVRAVLDGPPSGDPKIIVGPVVGKVGEDSARILVEPDRDVTVSCSLTAEGEEEPATTEELELSRGRPSVFVFAGLSPGTRYVATFQGAEIFTDSCSFRTTPEEGWQLDRGDKPCFAIVSCNKIYTSRSLPRGSLGDLWRDLQIRLTQGRQIDYVLHLGDNVYNDHEWYLVEKGKKKLEGHSCKWGIASTWLDSLDPTNWDSKRLDIEELFRTAYRETWGHPPTRYVLANAPNLMIFDDHDIRDDFGDRETDVDPTSKDYWLANIAYKVIREYQRQLYEDLSDEPEFDFHHHAFGDVGFAFIDVRGCKTFHSVPHDPAPFLGKRQWRTLEDSLTDAGGIFEHCRALLMLMPVPLAYVTETATMVAGRRVVDDLLGQWSASEHLPEVPRFLNLCVQWRRMAADRQVLIAGGDVHEGGWTDIFDGVKGETLKQLTTSAIANKMTKPHEAVAVTLTRSAASFYDGRSLAGNWKLTHFDWTNFRNYGLVECLAGDGDGDDGGRIVIQGNLIASDGQNVTECTVHSTKEKERTGQLMHTMREVGKLVKMGGSRVTNIFGGLFG